MKVGRWTIGRELTSKEVEAPKKKYGTPELGAGFLDLTDRALTTHTTVSGRLLRSYEGWVYANVSVLAEAVSKIEFELYKVTVVKGESVLTEIDSHPILDLLDRFNPFTTTSQAMYVTEAHLELGGDTFYLLDGDGANIKNIFILAPDKVTVMPGDANSEYKIAGYKFKDTINKKVVEVVYDPDHIIQIKNPNPNNPYRGKSVVEAGAITIDTDNLAGEFLKNFFKNGANPNFTLTSDKRITTDDVERIQTDLRKNYSGVRNAFKALILGGGLKPVTVQQSGKEMQFIELEMAMRDKVMAMFKNTKASLGIVEDVNRANADSTLAHWKSNVVKPKMQRIVDTLNEFLVPRYGSNLVLTFKDPSPEDRVAKVQEVAALMANSITPVISRNEARGIIGYDALPGTENDLVADRPAPTNPFPQNLYNINYSKAKRVIGINKYVAEQKQIYSVSREIAKSILDKRKAKKRISRHFSDETVLQYWSKQNQLIDLTTKKLKTKIDLFLKKLEDKAVANLHGQKSLKKQFDLFDPEEETQAAIDLLTPLMQTLAEQAGHEAYQLLKTGTLYIPTATLKKHITVAVERFAKSMIDTDKEKLSSILEQGIQDGLGVPQIERNLRAEFGEFSKMQSERIVRTETARASGDAAIDAWKESGVVEGKQWVTAGATDECAEYEGQIETLDANFYSVSEFADGDPPLHPNCRCVLIPVLVDASS